MDEKRKKIKQYIQDSDIPDELKTRELEIVDNENLSTPEVEIALAKLIGEEFDKKITSAGADDVPYDKEVESALEKYESEAKQAEKDLGDDMKIVDDNFQAIRETSEEIQKVALQASLKAGE